MARPTTWSWERPVTRPGAPWRRRGAVRYGLRRLPGLLRPPIDVYRPASGAPIVLRDLPVAVRDGTTLRVNVVLPAGEGRFPVLVRQTGRVRFHH